MSYAAAAHVPFPGLCMCMYMLTTHRGMLPPRNHDPASSIRTSVRKRRSLLTSQDAALRAYVQHRTSLRVRNPTTQYLGQECPRRYSATALPYTYNSRTEIGTRPGRHVLGSQLI